MIRSISVSAHRLWDTAGLWLVTVSTGLGTNRGPRGYGFDDDQRSLDSMPQCRCVTDDFGNLVPVRGWL